MSTYFIGLLFGLLNHYSFYSFYIGEILFLLLILIKSIKYKTKDNNYTIYLLLIIFILYILSFYFQKIIDYSNIIKNVLKYLFLLIELISYNKYYKIDSNKTSKLFIGYIVGSFIINYFNMYKNFNIKPFFHMFPLCLIFLIYFNYKNISFRNKVIYIGSIFIISIFSLSRTNILTSFILLIYSLCSYIFKDKKKNTISFIIKILLILFISIIGFLFIKFITKNLSEKSASNIERNQLIQIGLEQIKGNPLFGVGPGNYNLYARINQHVYMRSDSLTAHNLFLEITCETGLIGLSIFLTLYFLLYNKIKKKTIEKKYLFIYLIVFYLFNVFSGINRIYFIFILCILLSENKKGCDLIEEKK